MKRGVGEDSGNNGEVGRSDCSSDGWESVVWCGNWVAVGGIGLVGLGRGGSPLRSGQDSIGRVARRNVRLFGGCVCAERKFWSKTPKKN